MIQLLFGRNKVSFSLFKVFKWNDVTVFLLSLVQLYRNGPWECVCIRE